MVDAFPIYLTDALDNYKTPPLPAGFTAKLVTIALAQKPGTTAAQASKTWKRTNSPWKRGGFIASGVLGFGLVSAAAAAALSVAQIPIRIPIMTDLVERVFPVTPKAVQPVAPTLAEKPVLSHERAIAEPENTEIAAERQKWLGLSRAEKREIIVKRVGQNEQRLQQRRVDRGLAPLTERQLQRRRAAIRQNIANGNIPRSAVRKAVRRAVRAERRESGAGRGSNGAAVFAPEESIELPFRKSENGDIPNIVSGKVDKPVSQTVAPQAADNPAVTSAPAGSSVNGPAIQQSPEAKALLQAKLPVAAKKQLQQAGPAERRRMLREMRNRRSNAQKMRQARQKLRAARGHRR